VGRVVGELYPLLLLPALYGEIGIFTLHRGVVHDALIQTVELRLFGTHLSVDWIRAMPSPVLSWLLHLSYLGYYLILAAPPLVLWAIGRRDAVRAVVLGVMATFYLHYAVFIFFPVAGPRYFFPLADNTATMVWPARFAQQLLNGADSWGAAFPSSHVAASVVATGLAWAGWRPLGLVLLPATIGLTLAVVYGQFHYAVDALAGLVIGLAVVGVALARRDLRRGLQR
jgi:membrane-associated phospholipid phosphatase